MLAAALNAAAVGELSAERAVHEFVEIECE